MQHVPYMVKLGLSDALDGLADYPGRQKVVLWFKFAGKHLVHAVLISAETRVMRQVTSYKESYPLFRSRIIFRSMKLMWDKFRYRLNTYTRLWRQCINTENLGICIPVINLRYSGVQHNNFVTKTNIFNMTDALW